MPCICSYQALVVILEGAEGYRVSKIKKYAVFIIALLIFQLVSPNPFFILGKNPVSAEESINNELLEVPEGYIGIYSKSDLNKVRDNLSGNYILMNDIDLTEATIEGGEYSTMEQGGLL